LLGAAAQSIDEKATQNNFQTHRNCRSFSAGARNWAACFRDQNRVPDLDERDESEEGDGQEFFTSPKFI
jgi:hypothetical protein